MEDKVKIYLTPYQATAIARFLFEMKIDMEDERLTGLKEAIDVFFSEVVNNSTMEQIEDAIAETKVKSLIGIEPN